MEDRMFCTQLATGSQDTEWTRLRGARAPWIHLSHGCCLTLGKFYASLCLYIPLLDRDL